MTRLLSLDLATTCGWASLGGGVITSGSQCFARLPATKSRPAQHQGEPYAQFHRWLAGKLRDDKPDVVVYEEVCRWQGYSAAHCFGGYRGHMFALAAGHGIPCVGYSPGEIKSFWCGKGNADKDAMMVETRRRFPSLELTDSNEADALAILHLHLDRTGAAVPAV